MVINVLHIMQSLEVGGMENGVVNIVNKIDRKYKSKVYCTKKRGDLADKLVDPSNVIFDKNETSVIKATIKLFKYCLKNKPDIIHTHGWGTLISGFVVSKLLSIKIIHGEHGTVYFDKKKDVVLQKIMLSLTDQNLFVSKMLEKSFREVITSCKRNKVIYNGVDTNRFKHMEVNREEYFSVSEGSIIIGLVARLVPVKNHLWLIEALSEMPGDFKLIIVGDGGLKQDIIDCIHNNNMSSKVFLYGETSEPEVLMNCFDIFLLSSLSEGLSNTLIEAMSTGLPLIASDVGGNSELVIDGENGFLYESNNKSELIERLGLLINNKKLREDFGERSKSLAYKNFKMSRMIENYQDIYSSVYQNS